MLCRPGPRFASSLVVCLMTLGACGDDPEATSDTSDTVGPTDTADTVDTSAEVTDVTPEVVTPPPPVWGACPEDNPDLDCASVVVPLDYADPARAEPVVTLHLTRSRAKEPTHRLGVLFVNPGGPGQGWALQVARYSSEREYDHLARYFDIVGVDWRGTGRSTPTIDCFDDADLEALREVPQAEYQDRLFAVYKKALASCRSTLGDDFLSRVDVGTVARDHDLVRAALGEDKVNFFGASYGTFLGAAYATLFPDRVRAFVLDGSVNPDSDFLTVVSIQGEGFTHALERFFESCGADAVCPFAGGEGMLGVAEAWEALATRVLETPLEAEDGRLLRYADLRSATTSLLTTAEWAFYATALAEARDGDGTLLLAVADQVAGRNEDGSYDTNRDKNLVIRCVDQLAGGRPAAGDFDETLDALDAQWPLTAGLGSGYRACYDWPLTNTRFVIDASRAPRMLLVGSEKDPNTPLALAYDMQEALGNDSWVMPFQNEGHVVMSRTVTGPNRIRDFLIDPSSEPDNFSCFQTLKPPIAAVDDPMNLSIKLTAFPANNGLDAQVEVVRRSDGEVLAARSVKIGEQTVIPVPSGGLAQDVFIRASAAGYWNSEEHLLRHRTRAWGSSLNLYTESELTRVWGNAGFDPSEAALLAGGLNCDDMAVGGSAFGLSPQAGKVLHISTSPTSGNCVFNSSSPFRATDDKCSRAIILNIPEGSYRPTLTSAVGSVALGPEITFPPKTVVHAALQSP